jgi:acyl-coenzyme A synthetase/AMP-(fatty) acid ligase
VATLPDPERCSRPWIGSYPPGVPPTYRLPPVALPRLLDDAARDFPEHVALQYGPHTLTYVEFRAHVAALAAGLQTLPGDDPDAPLRGARVLVRIGDGFSGPIVLFALWQVGAVAVPIGLDVPADAVARLINHTGVIGAIGDPWVLRRFPLPPLRFTLEVLDDEWHGRRLPRTFRSLPSRLDPRTWRRPSRSTARAVTPADLPAVPSADLPAEGLLPASGEETLHLGVDELLEAGADRPITARLATPPDAPALAVVQTAYVGSHRGDDEASPADDGDDTDQRQTDDAGSDGTAGPAGSVETTIAVEKPVGTVPIGRLDVVDHTHRTLLATAFQTRLWVPDVQAGRERVLVTEPIHDLAGSAVGLLSSVLSGATTILVDEDEKALGKVVERTAATLLIGRSPRVERLIPEGEATRGDLTSLRVCVVVGGGLNRFKAKELERRAAGARVRNLAGWNAAAPITHGQPVYGRVDPKRFGLPVTSTVAVIVDPDDPTIERDVGETGRLLIHGPQLPGGGWVATDLIASVDPDGWFTVFGRADEVVDVGGKPRSPTRITGELLAYPTVREATTLEVDGELVAAVAPVRRKKLEPAELREALAFHLDSRALPDDIVVVDFLPRALLSGRDEAAVASGREELRAEIRAARGPSSMHTGPEADAASDIPPDAPRPSS